MSLPSHFESNATPQEHVSRNPVSDEEKGGRIKCCQCSEYFAKSTNVCPRCGRWNPRSPLAVCLKAMLVLVVVLLVCGTVKVITEAAGKSHSEKTGHESDARSGTQGGSSGAGYSEKGDQSEVKFNR